MTPRTTPSRVDAAVQPEYLTTAAAASFLSMSPDWVRAHAAELGGARVGDNPRGPLRFSVWGLRRYMDQRRLGRTPRPQRRRPGPRRRAGNLELLPIPDDLL
jgi:hypothetical protein